MKFHTVLLSLLIIVPFLEGDDVKLSLSTPASSTFPFEQLPLDMQREIINILIQDVITQKSGVLAQAQTYNEYEKLLTKELDAYLSVNKNMRSLIFNVLKVALLPIKRTFDQKTYKEIKKTKLLWSLPCEENNLDATDEYGNTSLMICINYLKQFKPQDYNTQRIIQIYQQAAHLLLENGSECKGNDDIKKYLNFSVNDLESTVVLPAKNTSRIVRIIKYFGRITS